jgi:hypothetical protein
MPNANKKHAIATPGFCRLPADRAAALLIIRSNFRRLCNGNGSPELRLRPAAATGKLTHVRSRTADGYEGKPMDHFWRFWDRLGMWQKFGLTFVAAVAIVMIALAIF